MPVAIIMRAILRTTGPILTHIAVRQNGASVFRKVSPEQFLEVAGSLQMAGLGRLVELRLGGRPPSIVFIKTPPARVQQVLETDQFSDLCTTTDYAQRYHSPILSSIPLKMRGELLAQGLVPPECF